VREEQTVILAGWRGLSKGVISGQWKEKADPSPQGGFVIATQQQVLRLDRRGGDLAQDDTKA
jgi:hypothetical protein